MKPCKEWRPKPKPLAAAVAAALVSFSPYAISASINWNTAGTVDWNTAGTWNPAQVPTSADTVIINGLVGEVQISAPGAEANSLEVGSNGSGSLRIENGTLTTAIADIGTGDFSQGLVTVGAGGTWTNNGAVTIPVTIGWQDGSDGRLVIEDGGVVNTNGTGFTVIGLNTGSTGAVTLTGNGSTWNEAYEMHLGRGGNATLTIGSGATVNIGARMRLAYHIGSTGTLNIAGGILNVESVIGGDGTAAINFNQTSTYFFTRDGTAIGAAVEIIGNVAVNQIASGTTILTGDYNYTGGTTISDGTLQIGNGGTTGSISGNVTNDASLVFDRSNASTFSGIISGTGTLTKQGAGILTLTGAHTYTGATTISAGDLVFDSGTNTIGSITAAGGNLVIQNGAVVNNDTGFVGRTGIGSATATVSGPGSAWNTTGDISVSEIIPFPLGGVGGTLRVENGGQVNAGGELLLDIGGVLEIDSGSQVTAAGGLRSVFGTIRLLDSGAMNIPDITANTVTFDTNGFNGTYAGAFSAAGFSPISKTGGGVLTLTGNTVDTDPELFVSAGTVLVNGTFAGNADVQAGGTLGGSGTVGNVTINGGTLAPGNSIGTLNVAGNVDFSAGGTYAVEVNAVGASDLINATGTATLTNGTVLVLPEAGNYNLSTDYTILTAAGGLGGTTFNSVSSNLAFLSPTLTYDANNVFLNLVRNDVSFSAVAGTPNQIAVGTTINTLSTTNPDNIQGLLDNLFILTADGANQAYDSLSGVQHTHSNLIALQSINQFKGILFDRISGNNQFLAHDGKLMLAHNDTGTMTDAGASLIDGNVSTQRGWWLRGTGNFGDIDDTRNATGANYKAGGIAAGLDFELTDNLTAGAAVGYTRTDADVANGGLDVDSYQAALYGRLTLTHDYYLTGMTGVGFHDMESNRSITVGLMNTSAEADYDAWTGNIAVEGGRKITLNSNSSLTPFMGLEYAHINRDSFTEKDGGVTNLKVKQDNQDSLRSAIGARITHSWTTKRYRITPTAELAWVHEFMEDEASIKAGFSTAPATTFSVDGPDLDRDRARLALGLNVQLSNTANLNLGYQGEFAGSDDRHDIAATFRMAW